MDASIHNDLTPEQQAWLWAGNRLELTLFVTERCNFRCTYCYEDFSKGRMRPDVVAAVQTLIRTRASDGLKELHLSFFGGEPLLARDIVLQLAEEALASAQAHAGLRYSASMTTNGWHLTLPTARMLVAAGVTSWQVSLDGPQEAHDRTRVRFGGEPTFERVWGNIEALAASDLAFDMTLRAHVTAENVSDWRAFADRLLAFKDDPRFTVLCHAVEPLGGPNDVDFAFASRDDVREVKAVLGALDKPRRPMCYAAIPTALVVRSDGALNRCTVAVRDPRNHVGWLRADGTLELDTREQAKWFQGWVENDRATLSCPLSTLPASAPDLPLLQIQSFTASSG